jgi:hypothetical protein
VDDSSSRAAQASQARLVAAYGKLPLSFEINQGQTHPRVKLISRGSGYSPFLTGNEAVLTLRKSGPPSKVANEEAGRRLPLSMVSCSQPPSRRLAPSSARHGLWSQWCA